MSYSQNFNCFLLIFVTFTQAFIVFCPVKKEPELEGLLVLRNITIKPSLAGFLLMRLFGSFQGKF